jgi:hypothetical protein
MAWSGSVPGGPPGFGEGARLSAVQDSRELWKSTRWGPNGHAEPRALGPMIARGPFGGPLHRAARRRRRRKRPVGRAPAVPGPAAPAGG